MNMTAETSEHRLKRLAMRSMRRGIKEMDVILGGFADSRLSSLNSADLDLYEEMLSENDHDLYQWASGQVPVPGKYADLMGRIMQGRT